MVPPPFVADRRRLYGVAKIQSPVARSLPRMYFNLPCMINRPPQIDGIPSPMRRARQRGMREQPKLRVRLVFPLSLSHHDAKVAEAAGVEQGAGVGGLGTDLQSRHRIVAFGQVELAVTEALDHVA